MRKLDTKFQSFKEVNDYIDSLVKDEKALKLISKSFSEFLFIFKRDEFVENFDKNAKEICFLDSVFKIFDYSYPIWILGHVSEAFKGIPTFIIISSKHTKEYLSMAINSIIQLLKNKNIEFCKRIIIDKDPVEKAALDENEVGILYCKTFGFFMFY